MDAATQRDLTAAAADLEQALELLANAPIALPDTMVSRARTWGLVAWRRPQIRQGWRQDRDQIPILKGGLAQYLHERGISVDQPAPLGEAEARRQRVSNRRGQFSTVTAAG